MKVRYLLWLVPLAIVGLLAVLVIPRLRGSEPVPAPTYWPTQGWQSSTPEEQGFDSAKLAAGLRAIRDRNINIHSLLVVRNGKVVVDANFYPYDGKGVHALASVTKSLMTTLIAIAADQGKLKLDQPMVSFFPQRTIANRDARKERITVRELASMSSGLDCVRQPHEPTLREMQASKDWVQFVLDRKVVWEPGTHFVYCSPAIHLLSPILQQATGMTALDFARQNLFAPLDIRDAIWLTDPQGYNRGSEGVYLNPRDAAKIGYLWLNKGQWDGKQIVSREWVENSVKAQMAQTGDGDDYGYGWWVMTGKSAGQYAADGHGGQRIQVVPALNAIVVTTGGGFEFGDVMSLLEPALVDMSKRLPANPDGVAKLNAALTAIAQPPAPKPLGPLPATARAISGKTFLLEANPTLLKTLHFEFNDSAEAHLHVTLADNREMPSLRVGLDGVYRMVPGEHDLPVGMRGTWVDARTFVFEYDSIANNDHIIYRMLVEGDRVVLTTQETAHDAGVTFMGKAQNP